MSTTSLLLDHRVFANNIWLISVLLALIYARSHVNVPLLRLQLPIIMLHRYLHERFVRVHERIRRVLINIKQFEICLDFLLATDHFSRYFLDQRRSIESSTKPSFSPKISIVVLLLSSLIPLTLARKLTSTTRFDLLLVTDSSPAPLAFNSSSLTSSWHAGCCILFNQTMCDARAYSPITGQSIYALNDTAGGGFLFDGVHELFERRRLFRPDAFLTHYEFLQNQSLFCQRYDTFRHLSVKHLAFFTYFIVVIGILFNICVFLVLIFGSMRRSTSFTLFLALTCFDLLSLASSLFALLFRTVMSYLKTSAPFCKMFGIFFLYFRQCSSTTLLLIAIERCIVIKYPFCRYVFNKFRLPLLASIMIIYVVPIPFDFVFYTSGSLHCEAFDTPHAHRYQIFRGFFTVFSYAIIPFVGISISNLLIIIELKNSKKRFMTTDESGTMRRFSSK